MLGNLTFAVPGGRGRSPVSTPHYEDVQGDDKQSAELSVYAVVVM